MKQKIDNHDSELLSLLREIALRKTKEILKEIGFSGEEKNYATIQYSMQFDIYHKIKKSLEEKE